jgi:hypothetical protein
VNISAGDRDRGGQPMQLPRPDHPIGREIEKTNRRRHPVGSDRRRGD